MALELCHEPRQDRHARWAGELVLAGAGEKKRAACRQAKRLAPVQQTFRPKVDPADAGVRARVELKAEVFEGLLADRQLAVLQRLFQVAARAGSVQSRFERRDMQRPRIRREGLRRLGVDDRQRKVELELDSVGEAVVGGQVEDRHAGAGVEPELREAGRRPGSAEIDRVHDGPERVRQPEIRRGKANGRLALTDGVGGEERRRTHSLGGDERQRRWIVVVLERLAGGGWQRGDRLLDREDDHLGRRVGSLLPAVLIRIALSTSGVSMREDDDGNHESEKDVPVTRSRHTAGSAPGRRGEYRLSPPFHQNRSERDAQAALRPRGEHAPPRVRVDLS